MTLLKAYARKRESDLFNICSYLLRSLKVNFTSRGLLDALEDHIEYPSLLSVKDTLFKYGIASDAIDKGTYSYEVFETPFICSIQQEDWPDAKFTIVTVAEAGNIEYLDPLTDKPVHIPVGDFEKIDKHVILLLDTTAPKHETNLAENRKKQRDSMLAGRVSVYLVLAAVLFAAGHILTHTAGLPAWCGLGFLLSSFLGLLISSLLIWNEIDTHNPFIREVCGGKSRKLNCNAVLSSSKASFGGISWSVWGFAFFAAFFCTQLLFPAHPGFMLIWSALSLLTAPYILFSVYYQWRVIKQWCPLCLVIQVVLGANALIAGCYLSDSPALPGSMEPYHIVVTVLAGLSFLLLANTAIPELRNARDGRTYEKKWKKLRYNPEIFQALLDKSDSVTVQANDLGIVVGNPHADNEIIKVCNPYCGPCSKAHPELEQLVKNNPGLKLRIIFTATGDANDKRTPVVAHLLAIQQKHGSEAVRLALDDWYLASDKDYKAFEQKYPMNGALEEQQEKIQAMRNWCKDMKIRATPTIYINGRELPDSYRVTELKNFF
ncbi:thioredoxin domain-containing protein [Chitinophaga oryzae]|uniref:Thioredoxin domain-containing protein n=1 Tax=Chitinophaga oryzae TaxID=2725414 RepID=A0AAE6ZLN9_9BACT|nr:vitamin K epoxide reductase family protein [Chitinophaga oryzae]QJB34872.1 thioredoxin domain-containing protein [Chitinophaga oryzae]